VGPSSDDREHSSAGESVVSHQPVHTISETSNHGSLSLMRPGSHKNQVEGEFPSVSSKDTTPLPTDRSLPSNDEVKIGPDNVQRQMTPSDGVHTNRRISQPNSNLVSTRHKLLLRGTPASLGLRHSQFVKLKFATAEEDEGSRRRFSASSDKERNFQPDLPASSGGRRSTRTAAKIELPAKVRASGLAAASRIEEEEERSGRRSTESSGKERNSQPSFPASSGGRRSTPTAAKIELPAKVRAAGLVAASRIEEEEEVMSRSTETSVIEKNSQPSLPASSRSRCITPVVAKTIIELPANVRATGLAAALKIEEEEEKSRRRSTETSVNEALHDKTGSNPLTPNSAHRATNEEADFSTAESRLHFGETSDCVEEEDMPTDLSEKKQVGYS